MASTSPPSATSASGPRLSLSSRVIICGSGVFGLSTALWLAKTGHKHITVYDMQPLDAAGFDPSAGIESASADLNKIMRLSYGSEIEYQRLAFEAAAMWRQWNEELAATPKAELPRGLERGEKLWYPCGLLRMSSTRAYGEFEERTLENMVKEGLRDQQFMCDSLDDIRRAKKLGWADKLDPLSRQKRFGFNTAVLDSTAGYVSAYKACTWAMHLAKSAGAHFVLGPEKGRVVRVLSPGKDNRVTGIQTADGLKHQGDMVIVACGGWTPSIIPEASDLLETTAGSVATIQLDKDKNPDFWDLHSPDRMPVITWGLREGKGVYVLPRTEKGVIKFGYRATKFTNYTTVNGKRLSVPKTGHHSDQEKESNIPLQALNAIREFITINMPHLLTLPISSTKLCWYTDSIDNSFLVDHVPGRPGLVVCSGGSGHGFKFLPLLGREVLPILQGKGEETVYGRKWGWRSGLDATGKGKRNGLEEGEDGPRVLGKQAMANREDWKDLHFQRAKL